jgi:hypothetical protein
MSFYFAKSTAIAARSLDNEMIIMSARDSTLFTLNEVASEIWQAADGRTALDDVVRDRLCAKFQTEPAAAYADAEAFCRELAEHGILLISDQPILTGG